MVYYTVRCDPAPGKVEELDRLLTGAGKQFWTSQAGVAEYHVYGDKLLGWPERTITIGVRDMASLQKVLDSEGRQRVRKEFLGYVSRTEAQIQELIV
ncbi:MAG: hypothetical protein HYY00_07320 [Chloroflexi bacterium]|nr:hypothetical protein [Chloroflexota bacterium]